MINFLNGANALAAGVVTLYYLKAWRQSRDELFKYFSIGFFLLTIERIIYQVAQFPNEKLPLVYSLRLLAFLAIAWGVLHKNLKKTSVTPAK
jgi:hypothetical protein